MAAVKLTDYERQRLENIRRREEMMAALNIHAKAQELSASSKRHRVQAKSYAMTSPKKKPKPSTPIGHHMETRRSLRLKGISPNPSDAKFRDDVPKPDSPLTKTPSARDLGPFRMRDAYQGNGSDRTLIQTIMGVLAQDRSSPETDGGFGKKGSENSDLGTVEGPCNRISSLGENGALRCEVKSEDHQLMGSLDLKPLTSKYENCPGVVENVALSREVKCEDQVSGVVKNELLGCDVKSEGYKLTGSIDLNYLTLKQENIARIVPGRILAVRFFPTNDMRMIMAGNKFGNIGFWDYNAVKNDGDGIYLYHPHSAPVSGISVHPSSLSKICSSSYDGFIRMMHAEREVFDLVYSSDYAIYTHSRRLIDVNCIYFGEGPGGLNCLDERVGQPSDSWMLHEARINSIDFKVDNPNIMATSSTDGTVKIWDLRHIDARKIKPLKIFSHKRAVHSAYFSPSGRFLATTSMDNNVGLLSGANFEHIDMIPHNNQTGRWISSFRGIWGWDDTNIFMGNMKRGVDVISSARKRVIRMLDSPLMSAIPCRFDAHPCQVGVLAGATSGGQVYIWTSS